MLILSIQYHSHDSSVALIKDGQILYAASEERFNRIKTYKGYPEKSLKNCLEFTKTDPSKIDKVVIIGMPPFPETFKEFYYLRMMELLHFKGKNLVWIKKPQFILKELFYSFAFIPTYIVKELYPLLRIKLALKGYKGKFKFVPHHESHMYSAYYLSGWNDCLVSCIEGGGKIKAMSVYHVQKSKWTKITECSIPHSAGIFYSLATTLLGFKVMRHEGKITGLSAFGDPKKAYSVAKDLLWVEGLEFRFNYEKWMRTMISYHVHKTVPVEFAKFSKEDLAAAFQQRLEDCVLEIFGKVLKEYKVDKIALGGGVFANVKLNQRILELPEVKEVFIAPAMGDDGLAVGAALHTGYENGMKFKRLSDVYFGPSFSDKQIIGALRQYKVKYQFVKEIEKEVAKILAKGHVVARFDGRMEWGPRALGNRTILSQATDHSINDTLNKKLKRTEFMPFAPVILKEYINKYLNGIKGGDYAAKFMTITFNCTPLMKKQSPAVVHIDNTARPQIIDQMTNPSYYKILKEYYKITGIPVLINTSFNMHEEPIVCTPSDAIRAFLMGNLDFLAIGDYLLDIRDQKEDRE